MHVKSNLESAVKTLKRAKAQLKEVREGLRELFDSTQDKETKKFINYMYAKVELVEKSFL